jgi:hypothetical protein
MTLIVEYDELNMTRVDKIFSEERELLVSLSSTHAKALLSFIETVRTSQNWGKTPYLKRIGPLMKALIVTLRIGLKHSRIFDLGGVIVINRASYTCEKLPNEQVLFRFTP